VLEGEDKPLAPAHLEVLSPTEARLTVTEGRYHMVRRMFAAVGNHVEALHRERMGGLALPDDLAPGEWRLLDQAGIDAIFAGLDLRADAAHLRGMTTGVKICGLTTPETLDAALDGGARFVGAVMFAKSPRHIEPLEAATLFERARGRAKVVAVVVDPDDALLIEIGLILKPDFIQLHGSETPARAEQVRRLTGAGSSRPCRSGRMRISPPPSNGSRSSTT
jgi:hypothetical protein